MNEIERIEYEGEIYERECAEERLLDRISLLRAQLSEARRLAELWRDKWCAERRFIPDTWELPWEEK